MPTNEQRSLVLCQKVAKLRKQSHLTIYLVNNQTITMTLEAVDCHNGFIIGRLKEGNDVLINSEGIQKIEVGKQKKLKKEMPNETDP